MALEALVLLPGVFADAELWDDQIRSLRHFADPLPIALNVADTMAALAEQVLWTAPPCFNLAGVSLGGHVAMEILRRAPGRVLRLALLNFHARPEPPEKLALRRQWAERVPLGEYGLVVDQIIPLLTAAGMDSPLNARLRAMALRCGARGFLSINQAMLTRVDSRPGLAMIECPTLVIAGRQDCIVPLEEVEEVAAGIAGARFLTLDQCGHLAPLEQPGPVTRAFRSWLVEPLVSDRLSPVEERGPNP